MISEQNYLYLPKIDRSVINLRILFKNRDPSKIYAISGDKMTLVSAMDQMMCAIPVPPFTKYNQKDDIMLNILEKYLHQMMYLKEDLVKNKHDFGLMLKVVKANNQDLKEVDQAQADIRIDIA